MGVWFHFHPLMDRRKDLNCQQAQCVYINLLPWSLFLKRNVIRKVFLYRRKINKLPLNYSSQKSPSIVWSFTCLVLMPPLNWKCSKEIIPTTCLFSTTIHLFDLPPSIEHRTDSFNKNTFLIRYYIPYIVQLDKTRAATNYRVVVPTRVKLRIITWLEIANIWITLCLLFQIFVNTISRTSRA